MARRTNPGFIWTLEVSQEQHALIRYVMLRCERERSDRNDPNGSLVLIGSPLTSPPRVSGRMTGGRAGAQAFCLHDY